MPHHPVARAARACALAALAGSLAAPTLAVAQEDDSTRPLRQALSAESVMKHLKALQAASDANGGNRAAGGPGYEASVGYVTDRLKRAGYKVGYDTFTFRYDADRTPPELQDLAESRTYVDGVDFASMTYSGSGDVTAPVTAVDLVVPPVGSDNGNTSGCEAADFAGFPAGSIALMQRGTCPFETKSKNAKAAGAVAAIVFNEGQAGREGVLSGTLGDQTFAFVPTVGTSFAVGDALRRGVLDGPTGGSARVRVDRIVEDRETRNVIAERPPTNGPGRESDKVLVVGAHLDSVPRGAGINDNGSGSGGILEIAEQLARRRLRTSHTIRFMWFSAEEFGLLGSEAYVEGLPQAERDRIFAMLNFDMIASPNYVRFVYDGDNSAYPAQPGGTAEGPEGSGEIERIFHDYFRSRGLASDETPFSGRSDYGPFIAPGVDIPAGGLFTGAEGVKTTEQALIYGGTAGLPFDPCYHLRCDDLGNINMRGLDEMLDAAGHTTLTLARRPLGLQPLVDPAGPVSGTGGTTDSGGGLHAGHAHEPETS